MRLACSFGLAMWICLGMGCKDGKPAKATREECTQAAEHIADLIMADLAASPESWWEGITQQQVPSGIPASVTKETFKAWLDTPEGKTWTMQRRGNTLTGAQQGIDPCVQNATHAQVACLIAAKDKAAVLACDTKFAPQGKSAIPAASATEEGSASGAPTGSAAPAP